MASPRIALAHAPEGAGNATRMIAVAAELRTRGHDVALAGGGPGTRFARLNDFDPFEPTTVDFIAEREAGVGRALAATAPRAARRLVDFKGWMDRTDPDVLLTDDPFAVAVARAHGIPYYRLDHSTVDDFDGLVERLGFRIFNGYCLRSAERFFYTTLHSPEETGRTELHHVNPIVHVPENPEPAPPVDVLVIPGTYSRGFDRVAERLRAEGRSVRVVGAEDWEPVPAMYPHAAAAGVVLCTGFSSIAEAVVSGTHCVVHPFIDCQHGIADRIERHGVSGVTVVRNLDAAERALLEPGPAPRFDNGVDQVVSTLERDLETAFDIDPTE